MTPREKRLLPRPLTFVGYWAPVGRPESEVTSLYSREVKSLVVSQ